MKKWLLIIALLCLTAMPVSAEEITAPVAPDSAQELMPPQSNSFGEDLWYVVKSAVGKLRPDIAQAGSVCLAVMAAVMVTSLIDSFHGKAKSVTELVASIAIGGLLLGSANSLISEAADTVRELSDYGKLFLPVMTAAMAAQGGITGSTALHMGTAVFDAVLSSLVSAILVPMIYVYLALAAANGALGQDMLKKFRDGAKWLVTWSLKIVLYIFTGYMAVTNVITGTADQAAVKAAKLTISGVVPVVGGILSDASEAILVSAGVVKNAAGVYGLLAVLSITIGPFLRIGIHYLLLKLTAMVCGVFGSKRVTELIGDFSAAMGLLLAMTGTVCLLLLISTVCFLKGVG